MANIGIRLSASGCKKDASTPVIENGKGPSSFSATHPRSAVTSSGTTSSEQTRESSSGVRTTQKNLPSSAQEGMGALGANWHTAILCSRMRNFRLGGNAGDYY